MLFLPGVTILRSTGDRDLGEPFPWEPMSMWSSAGRKIEAWHKSLRPQFCLAPENIYARQSQNQLTPLVMLHIWYHQCMTDLYRLAMPGFPGSEGSTVISSASPSWVNQTQLACVDHAQSLAKTFRTLTNVVGDSFVCLDPSLPMCIYESMRIRVQHLFLASTVGQETLLADFLEDTEYMLRAVERMKRYFRQAEWLVSGQACEPRRSSLNRGGSSKR